MQIAFIIVLLLFAGVTFFVGNGFTAHAAANSKSAIHEIEGILFYVMSSIFLTGALIIGSIAESKKKG